MKNKRAMSIKDLTKIEVLSDPQFTPDGDHFTYVSTKINEDMEYESHIYIQALEHTSPRQITYHKGKNSDFSISPNGELAVFKSDRSGTNQLWLLSMQGGEAKQLTSFKNGAFSPSWSKDGKYIIFTTQLDEDEDIHEQREMTKAEKRKAQVEKRKQAIHIKDLKYKANGKGILDNKRIHLILYDIERKSFTKLTSKHANHTFEDISPDGKYILFSANLNENADGEKTTYIYLLDVETKNIQQLTEQDGMFHHARFSPCGKKIAFLGHTFKYAGATFDDLFVMDIATKELTCLTTELDMQIGDVLVGDTRLGHSNTGPIWSCDESRIFFIVTNHGATNLYEANLNGKITAIHESDHHVFGFSYHPKKDAFILGISTPTDPGNFYFIKEKEHKQLTNMHVEFLNKVHVQEPETLTIPSTDGTKIQGWLLKPYGFREGEKYPFILQIHGGPHMMYGQTFFHEMQVLAAKGYVVLYTNPRGSHGYGQAFVNAVRSDYGGVDYTDVMAAVDYVVEKFDFIDEDRLGVTGGSYGGFMTNWIVGHTNRFKAAVTQRSISNWLSFYGVSDIGYYFTKWEVGHHLWENPEKLWDVSPLKYVKNIETPLLILHGELDHRCPIEQGEQLYVSLKHLKKEVEFVRFPDADHELSRSGEPNMRIARLEHLCRWFDKYL